MFISGIDLKNFVFGIFGNCRRQLIFAVVFRVDDGRCQSVLPTQIFPNSPCCCVKKYCIAPHYADQLKYETTRHREKMYFGATRMDDYVYSLLLFSK